MNTMTRSACARAAFTALEARVASNAIATPGRVAVGFHEPDSSATWDMPTTAIFTPLTSVIHGAYASSALRPAPKIGYSASAADDSVSSSPTWP